MGIYDREYYRSEGPSFLGSFAEQSRVCHWLIGINIVCFILQMVLRTQVAEGYFETPFTDVLILNVHRVMDGQIWRLLTYAFLHDTGSIWHIVFNMLFLFWFGRQVEDHLGGKEFLAFYLVSAVVAALAFMGTNLAGWQLSTRPGGLGRGDGGAGSGGAL